MFANKMTIRSPPPPGEYWLCHTSNWQPQQRWICIYMWKCRSISAIYWNL